MAPGGRRRGDSDSRLAPPAHGGERVGKVHPSGRLRRRAQRFAAVGEPGRLAIVEHLAFGDAAPSELGSLVDLPSNLLAHHLKVLEDAGLVRRVRSEGDRRRHYVQLRLDDPAAAALAAGALTEPDHRLTDGASRVVFVCTHNSARSQLASVAWQRVSDVPVASAGTHPASRVHPRAVATARRHGLTLSGAVTRHLDDTARAGDLLVAVCDNAYEEVGTATRPAGRDARQANGVDLHWSVPDPVRVDTDDAFESAYDDLTHRVANLAGHLDRAL